MKVWVITFFLLCSAALFACSGKYDAADNGFDKICLIYENIMTNPAYEKLSMLDKHEKISDEIEQHVRDIDAIQTYSAVASADPDLKYQLFKQSAEYSLKREWDCEIIKNYQTKKGS